MEGGCHRQGYYWTERLKERLIERERKATEGGREGGREKGGLKEAGRYYALFPCLPRSSHLFPPTRPAFCGKVKENAENLNLLILELPRPSNELTCFLSLPFPAYVSRTLSCSSPCSSLSLSLSLWAVCKRITLFPLPFSAVLQTHMEQRIGFEEILTKCTAAMVPSISTPGLSPPTDPPQCVCVCV